MRRRQAFLLWTVLSPAFRPRTREVLLERGVLLLQRHERLLRALVPPAVTRGRCGRGRYACESTVARVVL